MSPLQTEHGSRLDPRLACPDCSGSGKVVVPVSCDCIGRCGCGGEDAPCPECLGSGRQPCGICGDDGTVVRGTEVCCGTCDPEREGDGDDTEPSDPCNSASYEAMAAFYGERRVS